MLITSNIIGLSNIKLVVAYGRFDCMSIVILLICVEYIVYLLYSVWAGPGT